MVKSYMGCCAATFSIHSRVCYSKNHQLFSRSSRFLMVFCAFSFHFSRFLCLFPRWNLHIFRGFPKGIEPPGEGQRSLQGLQRKRFAGGGTSPRLGGNFFSGFGLAVGVYDSLWFTMFGIQTTIFSHYVTLIHRCLWKKRICVIWRAIFTITSCIIDHKTHLIGGFIPMVSGSNLQNIDTVVICIMTLTDCGQRAQHPKHIGCFFVFLRFSLILVDPIFWTTS